MVNVNLHRSNSSYAQNKQQQQQKVAFSGGNQQIVVDAAKAGAESFAKIAKSMLSPQMPLGLQAREVVAKQGYTPGKEIALAVVSFVTALTSCAGFGLGSAGLGYEFFNKDKVKSGTEDTKAKKSELKAADSKGSKEMKSISTSTSLPSTVTQNNTPQSTLKNNLLAKFQQSNKVAFAGDTKEVKKEAEESHGDIKPKTEFGKFGMKAAKLGAGISGFAGFFTGLSLGLPLMAAGELTNVCASPILDKPEGYGLFSFALSAIFAGRALEHDPRMKMDLAETFNKAFNALGKDGNKLGIKGLPSAIGAIGENMLGCLKEVVHSSITVGKNFCSLALIGSKKQKEAGAFFSQKMFAIKSKTGTIGQFVNSAGQVLVKDGKMKAHPYFMHTASAILAVGGLGLTTAALLQKFGVLKGDTGKKAVKAGFTACEIGGSLDNLSLSLSGLSKIATGGNPISGLALAASGVTMVSGQPNADKDFGRSLIWGGCSALFAAFAVERGGDLGKAWGSIKHAGDKMLESTQLLRQFDIEFTKLVKPEIISANYNQIVDLIGNDPKKMYAAEAALKALDNRHVNRLIKFVSTLKGALNIETAKEATGLLKEETILAKLKEKGFSNKFVKSVLNIGALGDVKELAKSVNLQNVATLGEEVAKTLV